MVHLYIHVYNVSKHIWGKYELMKISRWYCSSPREHVSALSPKVGPKEHIKPMEIIKWCLEDQLWCPNREYLFHCWLDPESRTKCHFPLFLKPLGWGLGNTLSVSFVPKPLGGPSVVFVLMHMSGATTEMPNTPQPDQSFRRTYELSLLALSVPCLRSPTATFYTALILDVLLLIFELEVAQIVA